MTEIDGVSIHFIHVTSPHENALRLIMTHGWPGSVIELLETVGPLTDPTGHGGTPEDAFHLVLPPLPGYGFSGDPLRRPGRRHGRRRHRRDGRLMGAAWTRIMSGSSAVVRSRVPVGSGAGTGSAASEARMGSTASNSSNRDGKAVTRAGVGEQVEVERCRPRSARCCHSAVTQYGIRLRSSHHMRRQAVLSRGRCWPPLHAVGPGHGRPGR